MTAGGGAAHSPGASAQLAHTHFVDLVEPLPSILPEHWELGLSELGDTTTLH
ncbi:hypothetical protein [Corallococcus macrosporus]|uniref:Tail protein n=1 Tax=Corallococcus macrosporus DSM 14697 TaxID=1189310 RepID=A0A250JS29_9BACT|nr:hypothetical protein [Corallococcus macrosporus]ATB45936.1 tail protein [Corallococcus macrosporus DSM 14697]